MQQSDVEAGNVTHRFTSLCDVVDKQGTDRCHVSCHGEPGVKWTCFIVFAEFLLVGSVSDLMEPLFENLSQISVIKVCITMLAIKVRYFLIYLFYYKLLSMCLISFIYLLNKNITLQFLFHLNMDQHTS